MLRLCNLEFDPMSPSPPDGRMSCQALREKITQRWSQTLKMRPEIGQSLLVSLPVAFTDLCASHGRAAGPQRHRIRPGR